MLKLKKLAMLGILAGLLSVTTACWAASSISADTVEYDFKTGQAAAEGNVQIRHDDGTASASSADYNTKTGEGKLTGSVVADQKDAHLTSGTLIIKNKGKFLSAIGNAVLRKADKTLRADQVDYDSDAQFTQTVGDWAQLTMDDGSSLDSASMKYNMQSGVANADGNVRLVSPPRNLTARADRAIYNTKEADGTIRLIGHATATQNDDTVSGDTLTITGAGGKVAMAEGDVKMVVVPQQSQPAVQEETPVISLAGLPGIPAYVYKFYNWPGQLLSWGETEVG
ncbi:LptA/OstA family protein [Acidaminococcus timonensis]|uniref:LptA/OstA family protein n=1 Tax=Acidaminococcus timonensis TaxID=1871002 RepID=UPI00248CF68A|nr:LptA/OstA family protein [Acidaminococcus timonensis]